MNAHPPECPKHHCHASGCGAHVNPEMLMCRRHWFMVSAETRRRVWATYRAGQCDDKQPSQAWHGAAEQAICEVAHVEYPGDATPPHRCARTPCVNCGEMGAHYVGPSFGEDGFFSCWQKSIQKHSKAGK